LARMVLPLGVPLELLAIEIHVAQIAGAVAQRLIAEMRRRGIVVLAARGDRFRPDAIAELDGRDEAVARVAVHLLRAGVRPRAEGREGSPSRRRERDRYARLRIVELLDDVAVDALVAVDVAPRRLPGPEVGGELVGGRRQRLDELRRRGLLGDVVVG